MIKTIMFYDISILVSYNIVALECLSFYLNIVGCSLHGPSCSADYEKFYNDTLNTFSANFAQKFVPKMCGLRSFKCIKD